MNEAPETRADLTTEFTRRVCRIGAGPECCRYLLMAPDGWDCAKHTDLGRYIDRRVREETFTARGDNCPGVPKRDL